MKELVYQKTSKNVYEPYFTYDYPHQNWKHGDIILIQHAKHARESNSSLLSNPFLAIFVGFSVWDMAVVLNFVRPVPVNLIDEEDPKLQNIVLWNDNVLVLGHWHTQPSITEIKTALKTAGW